MGPECSRSPGHAPHMASHVQCMCRTRQGPTSAAPHVPCKTSFLQTTCRGYRWLSSDSTHDALFQLRIWQRPCPCHIGRAGPPRLSPPYLLDSFSASFLYSNSRRTANPHSAVLSWFSAQWAGALRRLRGSSCPPLLCQTLHMSLAPISLNRPLLGSAVACRASTLASLGRLPGPCFAPLTRFRRHGRALRACRLASRALCTLSASAASFVPEISPGAHQ